MSDRKYRQRGYMSDDRERERKREERERRPAHPRDDGRPRLEGAPRGRGVGLPGEVVFKCAVCGGRIETTAAIEPTQSCAGCGNPLRTCTNCTFFNPASRFECNKTLLKRIESKTKANECNHFQPKAIRELRSETTASPDARSAFDALFKK
jgi:hypothetical protein